MVLTPPLGVPRIWAFAALSLLCAATGILVGTHPTLGLLAVLGVGFAAAVLANVTVGLFLFTILSFLDILNIGSTISLMKAAGLLLFVSWVAATAVRRQTRPHALLAERPVVAVAAIAWVSWSLLSVAWAEDTGLALSTTYTFLLNALLLPIVFSAISERRHIIWIMVAFLLGAVISALVGLVLSPESSTYGTRGTGAIGDPNAEAAVEIAGLMIAAGLVAVLRRGSIARASAVLAGAICLIGAASTGSRGGFIALGVALAAGVVFGGRWRARAAALLIVGAFGAGVYVVALAPPTTVQHLNSTDTEGRIDLWTVGWRMWKANPLNGVGSGNFERASVRYVLQPGALTQAQVIITAPKVTHNTYLEVMDELGVPGLIAFLTLVGTALGSGFSAARRFERAGDHKFGLLSRSLALAILAVMTASFFISNESEKLLWLVLALPLPVLAVAKTESEIT